MRRRRFATPRPRRWVVKTGAAMVAAAAVIGCVDRDRITFRDPGDGQGPTVEIQVPSQDTTLVAGPNVLVEGLVVDPDIVDSVFFAITGGDFEVPPLNTDADTVRFGILIATSGAAAGDTIHVGIFAVDDVGDVGDTAVRRLVLQ